MDRRMILTGAERKERGKGSAARAGPAQPPAEAWVRALVATGAVMTLIGLLDVFDTILFADWGEPGALAAMTRPMVGRLTMPAAGLGILAAGAAARPRALLDGAVALASLAMALVGLATLAVVARAVPGETEEGMAAAWPVVGALLRILAASLLFGWILWVSLGRLRGRAYGAPGTGSVEAAG